MKGERVVIVEDRINWLFKRSVFICVCKEAIWPNTIDIHVGQKAEFSCLVDIVNINIEEE